MAIIELSNEKVRYLDLLIDKEQHDEHFQMIEELIDKGCFWKSLLSGPATGHPGKLRIVMLLSEPAYVEYMKWMKRK